ncbi:MAG: hypothetical protein IPM29_02040 [Planctomycetes bacterium]|nr:hypothetical protein [Planctomycetota bacterium]
MTRTPRMRPTFELPLPMGGKPLLDRIEMHLQSGTCRYEGQVVRDHAVLRRPARERSLLSPYLALDVCQQDGRTLLRGRFSPAPNVWTGFMAIYGLLGMIGLAGSMYGISELMLGRDSLAWLAGPISLALIAFVYGAAVIGQGLTSDEMYEMRTFVDGLIRDAARDQRPAGY